MTDDIKRCVICDWPLAESHDKGCVPAGEPKSPALILREETPVKPARRTPGPRPRARSTPGQQGLIWREIQRCGPRDWSTRQIADETGVPIQTVQQYVVALSRGGFVRRISEAERTQAGAVPARWVRRSRHAEPPIVTWRTRTARPQGEKTPAPENSC